jgi:hypothetical protein
MTDRTARQARGARGRAALALLTLLAGVLAGCAGGSAGRSDAAPPPSPASSAQPTRVPITPAPPSVPPGSADGAVPEPVIAAAVADAAGRAGVDPGTVTVLSAESRLWPSGALGCPQPGFLYTDVITPGYRVVVEAGGRRFDYRAAARGDGAVRWCERPPLDGEG